MLYKAVRLSNANGLGLTGFLTALATVALSCASPATVGAQEGSIGDQPPAGQQPLEQRPLEQQPLEQQPLGEQGQANGLTNKASYIIGRQIMTDFMRDQVEMDLTALIRGMTDAAAGKESPMTQPEIQAVMQAFTKQLQEKQQKMMQEMADRNLAEGQAFLKENSLKPGVKQLENGVQYTVIASGNGPSPNEADSVTVHYTGSLIDGTVFDSSVQRGEPATFGLNQVIEGWTKTIPRMKVGDKWKVVIPSSLAYRESGKPPVIEPNKTLIFEIELLAIPAQ